MYKLHFLILHIYNLLNEIRDQNTTVHSNVQTQLLSNCGISVQQTNRLKLVHIFRACSFVAMKQQKVVKYLLQLTGFYWDSNQSQIYKYVGSIRSIIILIVCWYSTLFQFAILIINPDIWATYNNTYFLILSWNTQESIALVGFEAFY